MRCKIRLRDIVRSVSCISGEAAIHKKIDMIFFCFVDFDMVSLAKLRGSGQGCFVFSLFPSFWFVFGQIVLRLLLFS